MFMIIYHIFSHIILGGLDNKYTVCKTNTDCIHINLGQLACKENIGCKVCNLTFGCLPGYFCNEDADLMLWMPKQ